MDFKRLIEMAENTRSIKKQTQMRRQQGKFCSQAEKYCALKLRETLKKYEELIIKESDVDVLPGWEIDITINTPYGWNVAIEWDGAYHRKPIYGEKNLMMRVIRDDKKDRELYKKKFVLIRVKDDGRFNPIFVEDKVKRIAEIVETLMESNVVAYGKIEL